MSGIFFIFLLFRAIFAGQIPVNPIFSPCNFPTPLTEPTIHKTMCHTVPRLPFVCDLHHQLAYTSITGIEKAYSKYKSVFTHGNTSTLAVIIVKQLEQPAEANDVISNPDYACLFDSECSEVDGDVITGMAGNIKMFLRVYSWKVFERWFRHSNPDNCDKTNLLALIVLDGVVNDARKISYVRLHAAPEKLRDNLSNIQAEVTNALLQGWPLAKVVEDMVDDLGYALKEYYELEGEVRDHSVPMWARNLFLVCLALVITALFVEWYVVRRKIGVQKSGSIKIASGKSKTHLMF